MEPSPPLHQVTGSPAPRAAHAARPPARTGPVVIGIVATIMLVAAVMVAAFLLTSAGPDKSTPTSAQLITVTAVTTPARP